MACVSHDQELGHPTDNCSVCLREKTDARLLPCLHSFCRRCIDEQALSVDSKQVLRCPVCRAECSLPESGASGLLRDVTVCRNETLDCRVCREEGGDGSAKAWCVNCQEALCKDHVWSHVESSPGPHNVQPLRPSESGKTKVGSQQGAALCTQHAQPLAFFCVQCDVAICGHCAAIGQHKSHQPVLLVEEALAQKKENILDKTTKLQQHFLPRLQSCTLNTNAVKTQLGTETDRVRDQIETARQQAVDTIEAYAAQLLQNVDDIEMQRTKLLDSQLSELESLTEGVATAVRFSKELGSSSTSPEEMVALLTALDSRVSAFARSEQNFKGQPATHPHVAFDAGSSDSILCHGVEIMGRVKSCTASAAHSLIEGNLRRASQPNKSLTFTIIAKDENDDQLTTGGHMVTATFIDRPAAGVSEAPKVEIIDGSNGQYRLSFVTSQVGQYCVEVCIDGAKIARPFIAKCVGPTPVCERFDGAECQPDIDLSADRQTATTSDQSFEFRSVLGVKGARYGQMSWKLRVQCDGGYLHFIGVAAKPGLTVAEDNYDRAYSWNGCTGDVQIQEEVKKGEKLWRRGDVVELMLSCDDHTMQLTNTRTGQTGFIEDLPDEELYPYCCWYLPGDSMSFV